MVTDWDILIPELKNWNNGKGIAPESWVGCQGSFQLAIGYSLIFWPIFIEYEDLILRKSSDFFRYNFKNIDDYILRHGKNGCEGLFNHLHIADIHDYGHPDASVERLIYLGNILKEIHALKLKYQFPDRDFVVEFYEPEDKDLSEYQLFVYQSKYAQRA